MTKSCLELELRFAATELVGKRFVVGHEIERDRVDAIALVCRRWPIGKDVALVAAAARTANLGAHHAVSGVAHECQVILGERGGEAGPARAALEFLSRRKKRQAAQLAAICTATLVVEQRP